jgi:APA family basic amino acid/polyamine antiporter
VLIVSGTFEQLLVYSGMVLAFFMALTLSAIFPLRARAAENTTFYRIPLYPILPALLVIGALAVVFISFFQRPVQALYGTMTVLGGLPLYFYWKRRR